MHSRGFYFVASRSLFQPVPWASSSGALRDSAKAVQDSARPPSGAPPRALVDLDTCEPSPTLTTHSAQVSITRGGWRGGKKKSLKKNPTEMPTRPALVSRKDKFAVGWREEEAAFATSPYVTFRLGASLLTEVNSEGERRKPDRGERFTSSISGNKEVKSD